MRMKREKMLRTLQRMYMQDKSRDIDSKAGQIALASAANQNSPDYRTRAYKTDNEKCGNIAAYLDGHRAKM